MAAPEIASAREPTASPFSALPEEGVRSMCVLQMCNGSAHMPHANANETPVNMR